MISRKITFTAMLTAGLLIFLMGICFVFLYVNSAIIERLGKPDQSLLFWYLPILFVGMAGLILGAVIFFGAVRRRHKPPDHVKNHQSKEESHE